MHHTTRSIGAKLSLAEHLINYNFQSPTLLSDALFPTHHLSPTSAPTSAANTNTNGPSLTLSNQPLAVLGTSALNLIVKTRWYAMGLSRFETPPPHHPNNTTGSSSTSQSHPNTRSNARRASASASATRRSNIDANHNHFDIEQQTEEIVFDERVTDERLAAVAKEKGLDKCLVIFEEGCMRFRKQELEGFVLSSVVRALVGAALVDGGVEAAERVVTGLGLLE